MDFNFAIEFLPWVFVVVVVFNIILTDRKIEPSKL